MSPSIDSGVLGGQLPVVPGAARREPDDSAERTRRARDESSGIRVSLSAEGLARSRADEQDRSESPSLDPTGSELTDEEELEVQELKVRDREVRAHEAAHKAAAGNLVKGGASFSYTTGPDGRRYAQGGEVSIDVSPVKGDPQATARKMERVQKAALAPAVPSAQDRRIAARAAAVARQARVSAAREAMSEEREVSAASASPSEAEDDSRAGSRVPSGSRGPEPAQQGAGIDFRV